jgi:hypothetical protein
MKSKSAKRGKRTSAVEVANVSRHGFWLMIKATEYFLPFDQFPWFRDVRIGQLTNVELPSPDHLYLARLGYRSSRGINHAPRSLPVGEL